MYKFIDHSRQPWDITEEVFIELTKNKDDEIDHLKTVVILRPSLFFYATQEISIAKLREYYTEHAIRKLMGDGFIKFKDDE